MIQRERGRSLSVACGRLSALVVGLFVVWVPDIAAHGRLRRRCGNARRSRERTGRRLHELLDG